LIVLIIVSSLGVVHILQSLNQQELYFVNKVYLGLDYKDFYRASRFLMVGRSPYLVDRYVTPPVPAALNIPLARMSLSKARVVFFIIVLLSSVASYVIATKLFFKLKSYEGDRLLAAGLLVILTSYPLYFLIDRGNIDSLVILFMFLGLISLAGWSLTAGAFLALAVSMKVYPILLLPALLAQRRFKVAAVTILVLAILILPAPQLWGHYFNVRIGERASFFRLDENGSLACTLAHLANFSRPLGVSLSEGAAMVLATYLWFFMLAVMLASDYLTFDGKNAKRQLQDLLMYLPFMVAVPSIAYHYELVILIPLIPLLGSLWVERRDATSRLIVSAATVGVGLSQVNAVALEKIFGSVSFHVIPGFGLLLVMASFFLLKAGKLRGKFRLPSVTVSVRKS